MRTVYGANNNKIRNWSAHAHVTIEMTLRLGYVIMLVCHLQRGKKSHCVILAWHLALSVVDLNLSSVMAPKNLTKAEELSQRAISMRTASTPQTLFLSCKCCSTSHKTPTHSLSCWALRGKWVDEHLKMTRLCDMFGMLRYLIKYSFFLID